MGIETKHGAVKIDLAHRTLGLLKPNRTRPVLIKLHNFPDKAKILAAAKKKDHLTYEGSDIFISQDLSVKVRESSLAQAVTDNLSAFLDEKFARLESTLDSITTRLEDNTKRIMEAESRISQTEDKVAELHNKIAALEQTVQSLSERAEDAENRSRRDNTRIIGLKEGAEGRRPVEFFQTWLPKMMGIETKHGAVKIDLAHRTLGLLKPNRTRPVLIKLHNFPDKAKILAAAKKKDHLTYEGSDIFISQDLSVKVREARWAYNDVCGELIQRGVRFVMRYPANLCFNFNGSDYSFQCAQDAQAFLSGLD
uniref:L1 transposable element RRM domain-containing protein n=1 Tax=Sinocyclocheilus grahami TaxID=75366 RepID=A0A672LPS0_SINGR